jgi:DNA-binding MarR family transcriptional regulator
MRGSKVPRITEFGKLKDRPAVALSLAGYAVFHHLNKALAHLGITANHMLALAHIEANPRVNQSSLARAIGINRGSATVLVDQLADSGLVARSSGEDRRSKPLELTAKGLSTFEEALDLDAKIAARLFSNPSSDLAILRKVSTTVLQALLEGEGGAETNR